MLALVFVLGAGACDENDEDARPVRSQDIMTLASGELYMPAAGFAQGENGFMAVGVGSPSARVLSVRSQDRPWRFDHGETLPWNASCATGATLAGGSAMYILGLGDSGLSLRVARLKDAQLQEPVAVSLEGGSANPWWPQTVGLADGRTLLVFVEPQQRIFIGLDDKSGERFHVRELEVPEKDLRGVLAHVGLTADGAWVVTYQVADEAWRYRSFARVSRDEGATWSTSELVSPSSDDGVAGAFPIARLDRGADLYYMTTVLRRVSVREEKKERVIRRRSIMSDGALGAEQIVTASNLGDVAYPQPRRLPDGRIALMLTIQQSKDVRDLAVAMVDDAPLATPSP